MFWLLTGMAVGGAIGAWLSLRLRYRFRIMAGGFNIRMFEHVAELAGLFDSAASKRVMAVAMQVRRLFNSISSHCGGGGPLD
jgi:hypothetical protein